MLDKTLPASPIGAKPAVIRRSRVGLTGLVLTALLLVCWHLKSQARFGTRFRLPNLHPDVGVYDDLFTDWDTVPTSEKLLWVPCFRFFGPRFQCARLTVPMDYSRPLNESADHPKVHVAMVMVPGTNHSVESGNFSPSPLLLNPGGPGGSGTLFALGSGQQIQNVLGKHHDVIGFDPRGIGATWPQADCFVPDHDGDEPLGHEEKNRALMHRLTWMLGDQIIGVVNSSDVALAKLSARSRAISALCGDKGGQDSIFKYVGTPHVAHDMLSIVHAWDEWTTSLKQPKCDSGRARSDSAVDGMPEPSLSDTRGKLVFWGFSYGTHLGATFASMFPESVGRLVLDGVVDTDIYFENRWVDSLRDTDPILGKFYYYCHEARERCRLYRKNDKVEDIQFRVQSVMDRLKTDPLIVVTPQVRLPMVISHSDIKRVIFAFLYFPTQTFPLMATLLDLIYRTGDLGPLVGAPELYALCSPNLRVLQYPEDSAVAIACSDWRYGLNGSLPALEELFERVAARSSFADVLMTLLMRCTGWEIEAVDPASMDWETFPTADRPPVNTSFPVLFVSNTRDPITPLQQGLIQSQRFANAGFFEQLSEGHCTLSSVSLCSAQKIRDYINEGIVPSPPEIDTPSSGDDTLTGKWETCEVDEYPWKPYGPNVGLDRVRTATWRAEHLEIAQSLKELQREARWLGRMLPIPKALQGLMEMQEEEVSDLLGVYFEEDE